MCLLQTPGSDRQTVTIPIESCQPVTNPIPRHKQMSETQTDAPIADPAGQSNRSSRTGRRNDDACPSAAGNVAGQTQHDRLPATQSTLSSAPWNTRPAMISPPPGKTPKDTNAAQKHFIERTNSASVQSDKSSLSASDTTTALRTTGCRPTPAL
jgi:hypothetical protein